LNKVQIWVVEDEGIVALDLQKKLNRLGYSVPATVASGEEAVRKAEEFRPDVVLMDIRLKGDMDGIEAAQEIEARFKIPVIYLTALADKETRQKAKATGPHSYIFKPIDGRELRDTIEQVLNWATG